MSRSMVALTLAVGGLLFGCGGQIGDGEADQDMEATESQGPAAEEAQGNVTAMATNVVYGPGNASHAAFTDADNLYAYDDAEDGYAGVAQVNFNGTTYTVWARGAGNHAVLNLSVPAGTAILLRACLGLGESLVSCNGWNSFVAR
jgi:hypothetical protein